MTFCPSGVVVRCNRSNLHLMKLQPISTLAVAAVIGFALGALCEK